jgi:hypothetical protein
MKSLSIYLLLVGVPLALLVPLLRAGRGIEAPIAVSGDWRAPDGGMRVRLVQSGPHVEAEVTSPGASRILLRGRLRGWDLAARAQPRAASPCGGEGDPTALRIRFSPQAVPDAASAWWAACPGRVPLHRVGGPVRGARR